MSQQTLKFDHEGKECKIFFRYPDRITAKISAEERQAIEAEDAAIEFKRSLVNEAIKSILAQSSTSADSETEVAEKTFTLDDIEITYKRQQRPIRKGSGPITAEFHIAVPVGTNEEGKAIYEELNEPSKARFHTSSKRNSYEKARQYAIHNYFQKNSILEGSELYDKIISCYENRGEELPKFCKDIKEIENLTV